MMLLIPGPYLQVGGRLLFHAPRQHLCKTLEVVKKEAGNRARCTELQKHPLAPALNSHYPFQSVTNKHKRTGKES